MKAAVAAGKHIICEKPLEVTAQRIDEMISVCQGAGVGLAGTFPRRFSPATAVLKAAVDAGRFGRISLVEAPSNGGVRRNTTTAVLGAGHGN